MKIFRESGAQCWRLAPLAPDDNIAVAREPS
jgi:hypothetical protein